MRLYQVNPTTGRYVVRGARPARPGRPLTDPKPSPPAVRRASKPRRRKTPPAVQERNASPTPRRRPVAKIRTTTPDHEHVWRTVGPVTIGGVAFIRERCAGCPTTRAVRYHLAR